VTGSAYIYIYIDTIFCSPWEGKKNHVIAFKGGFHGRSSGSLSLTYKPAIREPFLPLLSGISFAEFNNLDDVRSRMTEQTCAIIVEPIQVHRASCDATVRGFLLSVYAKKYVRSISIYRY
jgi:acetylornithine/succinyldiaminopimelate/putrescine aminotransferase